MNNKQEHKKQTYEEQVEELVKQNPDVPTEIYDIEASQEVVEQYHEMFGY